MNEQHTARLAEIMGKRSDPVLMTALVDLDGREMLDQHERLVRAWIIGELERRHPAAGDAVQRAFEAADAEMERTDQLVEVDYVGVLIRAIVGEN